MELRQQLTEINSKSNLSGFENCRPLPATGRAGRLVLTWGLDLVCCPAQQADRLLGNVSSSKREAIMRDLENTAATVFAFGLLAGSWGFLAAALY